MSIGQWGSFNGAAAEIPCYREPTRESAFVWVVLPERLLTIVDSIPKFLTPSNQEVLLGSCSKNCTFGEESP